MVGGDQLGGDALGPDAGTVGERGGRDVERQLALAQRPGVGLGGEAQEGGPALLQDHGAGQDAAEEPAGLDLEVVGAGAALAVGYDGEVGGEAGDRAVLDQAGVLQPAVADPVAGHVLPNDVERPDLGLAAEECGSRPPAAPR